VSYSSPAELSKLTNGLTKSCHLVPDGRFTSYNETILASRVPLEIQSIRPIPPDVALGRDHGTLRDKLNVI
jgi:hypothetical protein